MAVILPWRNDFLQYIIMITIILGLAVSDFITGLIKAYISGDLNSTKMRKGGLNKLSELIVMTASCGLEIGIRYLGKYYDSQTLANITGSVTAIIVFGYIAIMEVISILENYAEINPDTRAWIGKILEKFKK